MSGTHGGSVPWVTWMSTEINRWTMNKQTWIDIHSGPQLPQRWTEGSDKTVSFIVTTKLFFSSHVCITRYKPCLCLEYIHSAFVENWKCKAKRWRLCPQDISDPITNSDKFIMMQSADNSAVKLWRDAGLCPTILEEKLWRRGGRQVSTRFYRRCVPRPEQWVNEIKEGRKEDFPRTGMWTRR